MNNRPLFPDVDVRKSFVKLKTRRENLNSDDKFIEGFNL